MAKEIRYVITLQGHLDKCWETCFDDLKITYDEQLSKVIGIASDQAALIGILNRFHGLGLKILSFDTCEDY